MTDRDYGRFNLIDTGVPHAGAIALGIGRSASISEVFRTIFPPNLVEIVTNLHRQGGGPSIFLRQDTKGKEFSEEEIYSYYGIRAHIQARQYRYEKGMGRRPFVGLWREEIVPFFGDNSCFARFWLPNSFSGILCLLTWHLSLREVRSLHAFEKSGASPSRSVTGPPNLYSKGNFGSSCMYRDVSLRQVDDSR